MNPAGLPTAFSIDDFMNGKPLAFSYVFDHFYNSIHFFANRIVANSPAAEDITQETFIKLWENRSGFSSPYAIRAFLYVTARNACFNFLKRGQTGQKNHQQWLLAWDEKEDNVLTEMVRAETIRDVHSLLDSLPPECRKIMRYHYIDGKDNREIAEILNISVHTVKNQKARALFLIKKRLGNRALITLVIALLLESGNVQ